MKINRREFLGATALGSAAAVSALVAASCGPTQQDRPRLEFEPQFSGGIARLALISEATRLALQDRALPDKMRRALEGVPGLASLLGTGILFPAGAAVISFLAKARRSWFESGSEDDSRVAVATGYLLHRTVEARIRKAMTAAGISPAESDAAKLQQDAAVIRSFLGDPPETRADAEALLAVLDRRLRIQIHTLRPDGSDTGAWVMRLLAWDAAQKTLFKQLAAAITEPDAEAYFRYVEALNFLHEDNPPNVSNRERTGSKPRGASLYELALEDCRQTIASVSQFLEGSISAETLVQNLG